MQNHFPYDLQIINDLEKTYKPRYAPDYFVANGVILNPRYVCDCLGNLYVLLKMSPNFQGKIRIDWLTIPDENGQQYLMPYRLLVGNNLTDNTDYNPIMYDIKADLDGFIKLPLILIKSDENDLIQSQPLVPFQPVIDVLHRHSTSCRRQMSPNELIREYQLNKSQLAFTLCTTIDGSSFVPQWYTTVFSTILTEVPLENPQVCKQQQLDDKNVTECQSITDASLLSLSVELIHYIFDFCDMKTIFSMRYVCKQMHAFVDSYNQLKVTFKSTSPSNVEAFFRFVQPERVVSLIIWNMDENTESIDPFYSIFNGIQFTRLRSLTFRTVPDIALEYFAQNFLSTDGLVSLYIESEDAQQRKIWAFVLSIFKRYNLRKVSMNIARPIVRPLTWPNQWKLEHLTIEKCTYRAYLSILQQLSNLKTFTMHDCLILAGDKRLILSLDNTFTSSLESLTMTRCSLSADQLSTLLSLTPSLHHLKLVSPREVFDSLFDGIYWEKLISMQLPKLNHFEFLFVHVYDENRNSIKLEDCIASFRSPFWLANKRWFVAGAYLLRENKIRLYTIPIHLPSIKELLRLEMSWIYDNFRLTHRSLNEMLDSSSDKTLTILDLHWNRIHRQKIQYLISSLYNNTTLVKLNLDRCQIGNNEIKDLAHALQNNTSLTTLWLSENYIRHEGAQYLANILHTNMTLKELYLRYNQIGDQGAQYFAHALQNNKTLITLDLHANGIGKRGIQDLSNALKTNQTIDTLALGYNQIGDQETQYLVDALTINMTLQHLYLDKDNISENIWNQFPKKDN